MLDDEPLRFTPTYAAAETEGRFLGLDLTRFNWVLLALLIGLIPGWLLSTVVGFLWAACVIFGPAVLLAAFQIFFLQDRPPGWFTQWVATRIGGGHLSVFRDR